MNTTPTPDIAKAVEDAIERVLLDMSNHEAHTDEYAACVKQLTKLYALLPEKAEPKVKMDTLMLVGGNLAGIVMILGFEKFNVITSKALSFVLKSRV